MTLPPPPPSPPTPRTPWYRNPNHLRTVAMFFAGLAGLGYETVIDKADKPTLVIAFLALMGVPVFLKKDRDKNDTS